jgi:hypothetical protein
MRNGSLTFGLKMVAGRIFMRRNARKWEKALVKTMDTARAR